MNTLLTQLSYVNLVNSNNPDCPELALGGLKNGLEKALPNSIVFLFTDAPAKDLHLYDDVVALIQKKQITVNFLLSGDCGLENTEGYQIFYKLSRLSGGQAYRMSASNVKDVLLSIKDNINSNYVVLKTFDFSSSASRTINFDVDMSLTQFKVTVVGTNPTITIRDPLNNIVNPDQDLMLNSIKASIVKSPKQGSWKLEVYASSAYTVVISGLSDLKFNFGFSIDEVESESQTGLQPLNGNKNILSIFASDISQVEKLSDATIITVPTNSYESQSESTLALKKTINNIFTADFYDTHNKPFKIRITGSDKNGNKIERIISSSIQATSGGKSYQTIQKNSKNFFY